MRIWLPTSAVFTSLPCVDSEITVMKFAIVQRRSAIGRARDQKGTIEALGIKRLNHRVVHEDSPQIRGMIRKVGHLLEVEEIDE